VQEDFAGLALDEALRKLLREFKLPGEAQQIDRIMETFAACYCAQHAAAFRTAEDAYRLAFAVIMLNTDAHNPMADHTLSAETFIAMNSDEDANGVSTPVLPVDELCAIFERVSRKARSRRPHEHLPSECMSVVLSR
jgi:Sec7-like guanine-nucleotide exchange factor